jgi:hypothetical protein
MCFIKDFSFNQTAFMADYRAVSAIWARYRMPNTWDGIGPMKVMKYLYRPNFEGKFRAMRENLAL